MEHLVTVKNNNVVTSSRKVAEYFGKLHKHVLESIREILVAENSATKFFEESTHFYRGQKFPEYIMTRDGFSLLAMGFTGKKALQWKIKYIEAFNEMEEKLQNRIEPEKRLKYTTWKNERVMTMRDFAYFVGMAPSTLYWRIKQLEVSYYKLEGSELVRYKQENAPWVNAQINNLIVIPEREVIRACRLMKLWTKTLEKALRKYFGVKENVLPSQEVLQLESTQENISLRTPENIQAIQKIKNKLIAIQCMLDELVECRRKREEHAMYGNFIREVSFAISIDVQNFNKQITKI